MCIPHVKESVLLGAAMLGANASRYYGSHSNLKEVATKLAGKVDTYLPNENVRRLVHYLVR